MLAAASLAGMIACGHGRPAPTTHHAATPPSSVAQLLTYADPSLRVDRKRVAPDRNGYLKLARLPKAHLPQDLSDAPVRPLTKDEGAHYLQELKSLAPDLNDAVAASKFEIQEPLSGAIGFPAGANVKAYQKLLILRGRANVAIGHPDSAGADFIAAARISAGQEAGAANFIGLLVGGAMQANSNRALQTIVSAPGFDRTLGRMLLNNFPEFKPEEAWASVLRLELREELGQLSRYGEEMGRAAGARQLSKESFDQLVADCLVPYDEKDTVENLSRGFTLAISNLRRPWREQQSLAPMLSTLRRGWPKGFLNDDARDLSPEEIAHGREDLKPLKNPVGRLIAGFFLDLLETVDQSAFKWRSDYEATRAILALKLWALRHGGTYPPALTDLVTAGILKSVPIDPYDGRPLHYDAKRMLIWSVGPNGNDDGGTGEVGRFTKEKDYVWPATGMFHGR